MLLLPYDRCYYHTTTTTPVFAMLSRLSAKVAQRVTPRVVVGFLVVVVVVCVFWEALVATQRETDRRQTSLPAGSVDDGSLFSRCGTLGEAMFRTKTCQVTCRMDDETGNREEVCWHGCLALYRHPLSRSAATIIRRQATLVLSFLHTTLINSQQYYAMFRPVAWRRSK